MQASLTFNDVALTPIIHQNGLWIRAAELARALGYSDTRKIAHLYERNADEFTPEMSQLIKISGVPEMGTSENLRHKTRIFSLRGCHLLAMFARTPVAKEFRKWVLDVLQKLPEEEKQLPQPALPPSRPQDARATYADMKHLRDLVRQWENVTGRMRRTIVRQYEAWLKTPTSRFTLDDVANAMLFVQARLDAIASEEAARRSAARELPPAREKEEAPAPVSVPGVQEDFLVFQREAGRLITGAYELVLAASEYRRAMKREERSGMDAAVTEKLTSACMAQATCMGQNIESLSRMLAILI